MPWPLANEFQDAVLNPQLSFADLDLRGAEVVCDARGLPIPASGQFGIVYQMRSDKGRWALKCFTSDVPGRADRYRKISERLQAVSLPFMVGFAYLDEGVHIGGQWYPILKMDWVEGQTLNKFVAERIDRGAALRVLVDMWVKLSSRLREEQITHADLQHGNIMLVPGKAEGRVALRLVDYDGMYLPSLAGTRSGEVGHPAYQHPQRLAQGLYGPEVDRFSNLVIYTALRALLARGRSLWQTYDNGENLLFTQADFQAPRDSKVLKELCNDASEEIRTLAGRLVLATAGRLEEAPLLEDDAISRALSAEEVRQVSAILGGPGMMAAPAVPAKPRTAPAPPATGTQPAPPAPPAVGTFPFRRLRADPSLAAPAVFIDNADLFVAAYGLALQGLKLTALQTSLLPKEEGWLARFKKKWRAPSGESVWGIDVGQCTLKALHLEVDDNDKPVVTGYDFIEHPKILSQPDADPDQLMREALETFLSRNDIKGDALCLAVPGHAGLARFVKLPPVEQKKLPEVLRWTAREQIPFPLDEVVWDYQDMGDGEVRDGVALDMELALFAMKRDMVNRHLQPWTDLGVEVHIVQMTPVALTNFAVFDVLGRTPDDDDNKKGECVVILDMGTDTTNLVITDGAKVIWQRPVPMGGNHFSRALSKELKLTHAKAESLKRNFAISPEAAAMAKAMKPIFQDLAGEIQRSLGYFTSTHRDSHVGFMLAVGGGCRLPGLQKFLSERLQIQVHKLG